MEILEDINDGMEWVLIYYERSSKQGKDPIPPMDNDIEFDVQTNKKELEKNLKLQWWSSDLQDKVNEAVTEYWDVFYEDELSRHIRGFSLHIDTGNHQPIC